MNLQRWRSNRFAIRPVSTRRKLISFSILVFLICERTALQMGQLSSRLRNRCTAESTKTLQVTELFVRFTLTGFLTIVLVFTDQPLSIYRVIPNQCYHTETWVSSLTKIFSQDLFKQHRRALIFSLWRKHVTIVWYKYRIAFKRALSCSIFQLFHSATLFTRANISATPSIDSV